MSWTDRIAFETILRLKRDFNINMAVITGVGAGGDAELYGHHFNSVFAVDIDEKSLADARKRLSYLRNVCLVQSDSAQFLKAFRYGYQETVLIYLDAHYYDPKRAQKWVVVDELKALRNFPNCVIVIHDYDNGLYGHLIYDGEPLGWKVIAPYIHEVNPNFNYYTNTSCYIYNEKTIRQTPIRVDKSILASLKYANSSDVKRYRGLLFATPGKLDLKKYQLKEGHG